MMHDSHVQTFTVGSHHFAVDIEQGGDHRMVYATAVAQGRRPAQEDCHAIQLDLEGTGDGTSMFAIFDGHSGKEVAAFASSHLPSLLVQTEGFAQGCMRDALHQAFLALDQLLENPAYQQELFAMRLGLQVPAAPPASELAANVVGGGMQDEEPGVDGTMASVSVSKPSGHADIYPSGLEHVIPAQIGTQPDVTHPEQRQAQVLAQLPSQVIKDSADYGTFDATGKYIGPRAGSTAVVALVRAGTLHVASVGDSRCVLGRAGHSLELTQDHKPDNPEEAMRIFRAGLSVQKKPTRGVARVAGQLAMSRALGDLKFKENSQLPLEEQAVSAEPDTRDVPLTGAHDPVFMVLACDGLWDVMLGSEVVQFVHSGLAKGTPLPVIAKDLVASCLTDSKATPPSTDNITVILVLFKRPAL